MKKALVSLSATVALVSLSTVALADTSNTLQPQASVADMPQARGSVGPFYVTDTAGTVNTITSNVTTVAGGISVGGDFKGGGQIWVVDQYGHTYTGPIVSGSTQALNDYISCPSGTYTVEVYNTTSSTQSYGPLTVYFN